MRLVLRIPPRLEPVSVEEVKIYLRVSSEYEDDYLKALVSTSRAYVEGITGRALLKQQWLWELTPPYPASSPLVQRKIGELTLRLPIAPLLELVSLHAKGKEIPYKLEEAKIRLAAPLWEQPLAILFWAGYGDVVEEIPQDLKMAVLMGTRFLYEGKKVDLPFLAPYRIRSFL